MWFEWQWDQRALRLYENRPRLQWSRHYTETLISHVTSIYSYYPCSLLQVRLSTALFQGRVKRSGSYAAENLKWPLGGPVSGCLRHIVVVVRDIWCLTLLWHLEHLGVARFSSTSEA